MLEERRQKEKETTDADADVFNDLTGGAKGERGELLTGQSDRQKSLGESKLQHGDHSWSWSWSRSWRGVWKWL